MNNTLSPKLLIFLSACLLLATLVEGQERDKILAKAEPISENLFKSMNEKNFANFARDFNPAMQKALPELAFTQMMQTLDGKVGQYQSRKVAKVEKNQTIYAVTYTTKYEKEDPVSWRVVLSQSEPMQVSGLWYDSAKLRQK